MRVDIGTAAGTGVISDTNDAILVIEFHARSSNGQSLYVGVSDVTEGNGRELAPGESFTINCSLPDNARSSGSVLFSSFYSVITGSDKLDWTALIR